MRQLSSVIAAVLTAPTFVLAQWLHYPTAGVPRLADGRANLAAPAPRLADGRPDLSGIWQSARKLPWTKEVSRFVECGIEITLDTELIDEVCLENEKSSQRMRAQ